MAILKARVTQTVTIDSYSIEANNNTVDTPAFKHLETNDVYPATVDGTSGWYIEDSNDAPDGHYVFMEDGVVLPGVFGSEADGGTWHGDGDLPYLQNNPSDGHYDAVTKRIKNIAVHVADTDAMRYDEGATLIDTELAAFLVSLLAGFTMSGGGINMGNNKMTNLGAGTASGDAIRYDQLYNNFLRLNPDPQTTQSLHKNIFIRDTLTLANDAASLQQATRKGQVAAMIAAAIAGIVAGDVTAAQQAGTIIIVDPSGTQEDHRRYTTLEGAKIEAESYAEEDEIITIEFQGNGVDGVFTHADYNLLPAGSLAPFVHYRGFNRSDVIRVSDSTYTGDATDRTEISICTIDNESDSATTSFINEVFENVTFKNTFGVGNYSFTNCQFKGDCQFTADCSCSFNSACTGKIYDISFDRYIYLGTGIYGYDVTSGGIPFVNTDGDIVGRRILGRSDSSIPVTMASSLTLLSTQGNVFLTTGGTTVTKMETNNWTEGSIVTFVIGTNVTINHNGGSTGTIRPFQMNAGANKALTVGQTISFVLFNDSWYEI